MTTMTTVDIALVEPHPRNVRRDDTPDEELVASIETQGILQPLGVVQHEDGYMLVAGHRRLQAARAACLAEVPIVVLDHLDTDAKVIEAMLVENGRRQDLSPVEEAAGYEQLELAGYDVAAIASATGRATSTVRQRLRLSKLSATAQDALHDHQMTLEQAEQLAALADFPALQKEAEKAIGADGWGWKIRDLDNQRQRIVQNRQLQDEMRESGLPQLERPKGGWNYRTGPRPCNRGEADACYLGEEDGSWETQPAWLRAPQEGDNADELARQERWRKDEEKRRREEKRQHAAKLERLKHAVDLAAGMRLPAVTAGHVQLGVAQILAGFQASEIADVIEITGLPLERVKNDYGNHMLAKQVLELKGADVVKLHAAVLASAAAGNLYLGYGDGETAQAARSNAREYWSVHEKSGHDMNPVDKKLAAKVRSKDDEKP